MGAQEVAVSAKLVNEARERARLELSRFSAARREPLDAVVQRAAAVVERYCVDLLEEVLASTPSDLSTEAAASVRKRYTDLVLEFGLLVRDVETDSFRRHAVAQAVQR